MPKIGGQTISHEALEMLEEAVWVGRGQEKIKIVDMSTKRLIACLRIIEEDDYGADSREAVELELEIRRLGLRGPFLQNTTGTEYE